jgi:enoyl-CoA hydratase/carnithine racemase
MEKQHIQLDIKDNIAHLILSNPPKNEMNKHFFNALSRLRTEEFGKLNVSAMFMYGKGKHFSSGADLDELRLLYHATSSSTQATSFFTDNHATFQAISQLPFPVVAIINGCCLGAGLELALACRYRIASPRAVFSLPEVTFGLIPGCGGTVRLPKVISKSNAVEMIVSGKIVAADEALSIGLIDACVEKQFLMDKAMSMIKRQTPCKTADRIIHD